ncbi:MAG: hypothetical protein WC528_03080 [Patescibacteria group bacterium]
MFKDEWARFLQTIICQKKENDTLVLALRCRDRKKEILIRGRFHGLDPTKQSLLHGLFMVLFEELRALGPADSRLFSFEHRQVWAMQQSPESLSYDDWQIVLPYADFFSYFQPILKSKRGQDRVVAEKIFDL